MAAKAKIKIADEIKTLAELQRQAKAVKALSDRLPKTLGAVDRLLAATAQFGQTLGAEDLEELRLELTLAHRPDDA